MTQLTRCCKHHSVWCGIGEDGPPLPCCWDCPDPYNQRRLQEGAHRPSGTGWPR